VVKKSWHTHLPVVVIAVLLTLVALAALASSITNLAATLFVVVVVICVIIRVHVVAFDANILTSTSVTPSSEGMLRLVFLTVVTVLLLREITASVVLLFLGKVSTKSITALGLLVLQLSMLLDLLL